MGQLGLLHLHRAGKKVELDGGREPKRGSAVTAECGGADVPGCVPSLSLPPWPSCLLSIR